MKKILLLLSLLLVLNTTIFAQKKITYGIKAGLTFPHMTLAALGTAISFDSKTSFYVGGITDIRVSNILSIQPGLSLVNKGTKVSADEFNDEDVTVTSSEGTINLMYIEVPVNLMLNFKTGNSGKLFIGGGPYYAIGIDGYAKSEGVKEDIEFGSSTDQLKRGEFGLNFLGGYQLDNGLNLHLGYGLGISNVLPKQDEIDVKFKNRVFSVGLGFNF